MELTINGEKRTIEHANTLDALMKSLGYSSDTRGIAVAVNSAVVPKAAWVSTRIAQGDTVDIIHAVQGG